MEYFTIFNQIQNFIYNRTSDVYNFILDKRFHSVEYIQNRLKEIAINTVFLHGKWSVIMNNAIQELYVKYPIVKEIVYRSIYYADFFWRGYHNMRLEPYVNNWVSTSALVDNGYGNYEIFESYHYKDPMVDFLIPDNLVGKIEIEHKIIHNSLNTLFNNMKILNNSVNEIKETMMVFKNGNKRFIDVYYGQNHEIKVSKNNPNVFYNFPLLRSRVKFPIITYTHPSMLENINIELDDEYYVSGSKILSSLFVKRYLEHHYMPDTYFFDENYKLSIIDNNIKNVELKSNQYVVLGEKLYHIDIVE